MRRIILAILAPLGAALLLGSAPASAGGGCFQPSTTARGTAVALQGICFSPTILLVQPGDTVTWVNRDGIRHIVAGSLIAWGSPATLEDGQSVSHQFPTAGIFPYSCPLHMGMNAVVIVGDGNVSGLQVAHLAQTTPAAATTAHSSSTLLTLLAVGASVLTGLLGFAAGRLRTRSAGGGSTTEPA